MQTEHLKVIGMTCGGCISHITAALKEITGVVDVTVSLFAGDAAVRYDERLTSPDQLRLAVEGMGYGVDVNVSADSLKSKGSFRC